VKVVFECPGIVSQGIFVNPVPNFGGQPHEARLLDWTRVSERVYQKLQSSQELLPQHLGATSFTSRHVCSGRALGMADAYGRVWAAENSTAGCS
jgi:hypothetical protein